MPILIDGYNLLNSAGVQGRGTGTALAQARRGLLDSLTKALTEDELAATTIVFDSKDAPPGLPREEQFGAIRVLFAKGYQDADELIEELIVQETSPRQLLVVSSDHRLHRAARRRRASAVDSHQWLADLGRRSAAAPPGLLAAKPATSEMHTATWLAEFGDIDVDPIRAEVQKELEPNNTLPPPDENQTAPKRDKPAAKPPRKQGVDDHLLPDAKDLFPPEYFAADPSTPLPLDDLHPFPPGYGEDVLDEDAK